MQFLVDENLPGKLGKYLESLGHEVIDVASTSYRGSSDEALWKLASERQLIIITRDLDFPLPLTKSKPLGLILIRIPDTFTSQMTIEIFGRSLKNIEAKELKENIVVISPGKIRFRKL